MTTSKTTPASAPFSTQFWLMFAGLVISSTGTTMIWPFLTIYTSERLGLPMAAVTSLMSFNAIAGLVSSILAGALVDRFGRKWIMTIGLFGAAAVYLVYAPANQYWHFAVLMSFAGLFSPLYRLGTDASVADLVPQEQRTHAYSLIRMGPNIGVAVGPILGGLILASSYRIGFFGAAAGLSTYGLISIFFLKETLKADPTRAAEGLRAQFRVYRGALRNKLFTHLVGAFTLMEISSSLIWVLLAVYMKQNFGLAENVYSWIPTTNALIVVFLQVFVTRITTRYRKTQVMPYGAAFYVASMLIIATSQVFWGFWAGMVMLTFGELITAPTATSFVADIAPADQRGRYLGMFGLTWPIATAIGPLAAGFLTDQVSIQAPWFGGAAVTLLSVAAYLTLDRRAERIRVDEIVTS